MLHMLPSPFFAAPNVTARPSTVSVPISVLLYDGPLLCGFNVTSKGLSRAFTEAAVEGRLSRVSQNFSSTVKFMLAYSWSPYMCHICLKYMFKILKNLLFNTSGY